MATQRRSSAADLTHGIQRILYATSVAALFAATVSLVPRQLHAQSIDTLAIRAHTRFLADNLLRGRGTGTEGERIAASYIESQLIALGATGVGRDGSFTVGLRVTDTAGATVLQTVEYFSKKDLVWKAGAPTLADRALAQAFEIMDAYNRDHGVPDDVISNVWTHAHDFFDLRHQLIVFQYVFIHRLQVFPVNILEVAVQLVSQFFT